MRSIFAALRSRLMPPSETLEGYEHPELIEVIFQKTARYNPSEPWPEIAGATSVLDFGGGCGIHYKQAALPNCRWAVVETPAMVQRARELETANLRFFSDIDDAAAWLGPIDVMHSNGALQYAPDPEQKLKKLCGLRATTMLWYRVIFSAGGSERETQSSLLGDNGPGLLEVRRKRVLYDRTRIPEDGFLLAHGDYELLNRGDDWFRFVRVAERADEHF